MTKQLETRDGAIAWAKEMLPRVAANFRRFGYLEPVFQVLLLRDPGTQQLFDKPRVQMAVGDMSSDRAKDMTAGAIASLVLDGWGLAVLSIVEAWITDLSHADIDMEAPDADDKAFRAQAEAKRKGLRREAAIVTLEHRALDLPMMWTADIIRPPKGKAYLGSWKEIGTTAAKGRFAEFLRETPIDETH